MHHSHQHVRDSNLCQIKQLFNQSAPNRLGTRLGWCFWRARLAIRGFIGREPVQEMRPFVPGSLSGRRNHRCGCRKARRHRHAHGNPGVGSCELPGISRMGKTLFHSSQRSLDGEARIFRFATQNRLLRAGPLIHAPAGGRRVRRQHVAFVFEAHIFPPSFVERCSSNAAG